jgi:hypothetical protein
VNQIPSQHGMAVAASLYAAAYRRAPWLTGLITGAAVIAAILTKRDEAGR